jgi:hypothetical protein
VTFQNDPNRKKESETSAGLAGAGGGTLVAVIASQLPDDNAAKSLLIYLAPSISILLTLLWGWVRIKFLNYINDREFERLIDVAIDKLDTRIADPNISEEYRDSLKRKRQEFDEMSIDRIKSQIQAVTIYTNGGAKGEIESEKPIIKSDPEDDQQI